MQCERLEAEVKHLRHHDDVIRHQLAAEQQVWHLDHSPLTLRMYTEVDNKIPYMHKV